MRIIFIPGFGEDETIFDNLAPLIPGEKLILNTWTLAGDEPREATNALLFAKEVVERYSLTKDDMLIGQLMGGWIAYHIKHLVHCRIIHLASMTSTDRIMQPVADIPFFYWAIKKGIVFTSIFKKLAILIYYKSEPSEGIVSYIIDMLISRNKNNVNNQLKIVLRPVGERISVQPELRIHPTNDTIVRPPKEDYIKVPGDHFFLYTHPVEVAAPILSFLHSIDS